jgi:AhpD family alkylhydroperoxidase
LFAVAIAVRKGCDGCIASHARGVVRTGATESEVAEALGVAIALNGGPGTVYGARAFAAFREFLEQGGTDQEGRRSTPPER